MLDIKKISIAGALFLSSCFSFPLLAAEFTLTASSNPYSITSITSASGEKMAGLVLEPGEKITIRCLGSVTESCNIGQFVIKTDYQSAGACLKKDAEYNPNCAKMDINWQPARIYSDHGNTGVILGPLKIKGEYKYKLKNASSYRKLYFVLQNDFSNG